MIFLLWVLGDVYGNEMVVFFVRVIRYVNFDLGIVVVEVLSVE